MKIAALLLAAGASRRMGQSKQLLVYQNEPLVRRAARRIIEADFSPVCVVVGANGQAVSKALDGLDVMICSNIEWEKGIGSSIRAGVEQLESLFPDIDGVLVALADQPTIPASHFSNLRAAFADPESCVASGYSGSTGVPAIFGRNHFAQLVVLPDDHGAKPLLTRLGMSVLIIPLSDPRDIDLPADYDQLRHDDYKCEE